MHFVPGADIKLPVLKNLYLLVLPAGSQHLHYHVELKLNKTMTDSPDYRLYLGKCMKDIDVAIIELKGERSKLNEKLDKLIENNIIQSSDLKEIKDQTKRTNNRVTHLEEKSEERQVAVDDFRHLEKEFKNVKEEIGTVRGRIDKMDKDLLEVWFFKKYPRVLIGILTAAIIAALILVRTKISTINDMVRILDQKVDLINVPMRTRGGNVILMPAGVALDSLNKDTTKTDDTY